MAQFTWQCDYGAALTRKPLTKVAKFGDGYEQRAQFGINNNPQTWDIKFINRLDVETNQIDAFLAACASVQAFDWVPPRQTQTIRVVCDEWSISADKYNLNTITAKFRQVFEA